MVYHKIKTIAQMDVKGHVLDLVDHNAFNSTSTLVIYNALEVPTEGYHLVVVIVFKQLDGSILHLSGAKYWKVYWETFLCEFTFSHHIPTHFLYFLAPGHYSLRMQGVLHCIISNGNLMYRRDRDTHKVIGVLGGFDLASLNPKASQNTEQTSTGWT